MFKAIVAASMLVFAVPSLAQDGGSRTSGAPINSPPLRSDAPVNAGTDLLRASDYEPYAVTRRSFTARGAVDYVVHYPDRIVTHRGGLLRSDTLDRYGFAKSSYFGLPGSPILTTRSKEGTLRSLSIWRPTRDKKSRWWSRDTGNRQSHLGEECRVWQFAHSEGDVSACFSDDGIALWEKFLHPNGELKSSSEAIRIERRPVDAAEVRPPPEILKLETWLEPLAQPTRNDGRTLGDYESVFPSATFGATDTTRRHYPWTSTEASRNYYGERVFTFTKDLTGPSVMLNTSQDGAFMSLEIFRGPPTAAIGTGRSRSSEPQTLHGEVCTWTDAVLCETADGVALKRVYLIGRRPADALGLSRRPVLPSEVMPPADLLDPRKWGLAE